MAARKTTLLANHSILLVDDNSNGLKARKTVLEELGYDIVTASNGFEALERFETRKFQLVVTDYKMPRVDGLELIAHLRKREPNLPIILISGFADTLGLNEDNTKANVVIQKNANEVSTLTRAVTWLLKGARKPSASAGVSKAKKRAV